MTIARTILSLSVMLCGSCATVSWADYEQTEDFARVLSSRPIYRTIEDRVPQERCWNETVREETRSEGTSPAGAIVGGVVGGALGHAVGHGSSNKKIGTAVGVVLGATVGNQVARDRAQHEEVSYRDRERCQTSHAIERRQEIVGYDVDYQYLGRTFSTRMDHNPGNRIRVAVRVEPLE